MTTREIDREKLPPTWGKLSDARIVELLDFAGRRVVHMQVAIKATNGWTRVDAGIQHLLTKIWHQGITTHFSCEGIYTKPGDGEDLIVAPAYVAFADLDDAITVAEQLDEPFTEHEALTCMDELVPATNWRAYSGHMIVERILDKHAHRPDHIGHVGSVLRFDPRKMKRYTDLLR